MRIALTVDDEVTLANLRDVLSGQQGLEPLRSDAQGILTSASAENRGSVIDGVVAEKIMAMRRLARALRRFAVEAADRYYAERMTIAARELDDRAAKIERHAA